MSQLQALGSILLVAGLCTACKSPRPPYESARGDVSGEWSAESEATPRSERAGEMRWRMRLDQGQAGKLDGSGELSDDRGSSSFTVTGIRGQSTVNFELHMEDGGAAKFDGSVLDVKMMVGKMNLGGDTIAVTFVRP